MLAAKTAVSAPTVATTCCSGSPANGVETTAAAGANWRYLSQCVGGLSASTYDFGAWVMRSSDPLLVKSIGGMPVNQSQSGTGAKIQEAGFDQHLTKPVEMEQLQEVLSFGAKA